MKSALEPSVPLLCVRDLCAEFGDFALQDIALEVWANERVGIVGESGSGKSLLAKLLMGLVQGNVCGEICLQGIEQNLATIPINSPLWRTIRAQKIAYIPQSPKLSLSPLHTIGKQLAEMCALHLPHTPKAKYQALIDRALESVGLEPSIKHRLPHTLSGGQAQRVCIAMMILARPKILLCDEPTTALDAHIQSQILALLDSFTEMAIVFITHDLGLIGRFAERVYVMQGGQICDHLNTMDSVLGSHSADFGDFRTTADLMSSSALKSPKNYESNTAIPRILEEDNQTECEKSAENQKQPQSKKVDSSNEAFLSSLRDTAPAVAWQSNSAPAESNQINGACFARNLESVVGGLGAKGVKKEGG